MALFHADTGQICIYFGARGDWWQLIGVNKRQYGKFAIYNKVLAKSWINGKSWHLYAHLNEAFYKVR